MNLLRRVWYVLRIAVAELLAHVADHVDPDVRCEHHDGGRSTGRVNRFDG